MDITCEVKMLRHQKNEFTMSVRNHTATVICKNKREGKQRASQAILQVRQEKLKHTFLGFLFLALVVTLSKLGDSEDKVFALTVILTFVYLIIVDLTSVNITKR